MAASIAFTFRGPPEQKHTIKVPPMGQLKANLADVCAKLRPPLDAVECAVVFNGKELDLSTPFRLLNIPNGSKLEIVKVAPAVTTVATPAANRASSDTAKEKQAGTAHVVPSTSLTVSMTEHSVGVIGGHPCNSQLGEASQGFLVAAPDVQQHSPAPDVQQQPPFWASLGMDREVFVFSQHAVEAAAASTTSRNSALEQLELDDAFFELTPDDWVLLQRDLAAKRKAEGALKTQAAREAEVHARATSFGAVPVRVHFPDGTILQASFAANDPLELVYNVVQRCLTPDMAASMHGTGCATLGTTARAASSSMAFLYTTPPKQVLKDRTQTLYEAGLVPAAHMYFHPPEAAGPQETYLRPDVMAVRDDCMPMGLGDVLKAQNASSPGHSGAGQGAPVPAVAGSAPGRTPHAGGMGPSRTPKWMKLSGA